MHSKDLYARLELLSSEHRQTVQQGSETSLRSMELPPRWQRWAHAALRYFVGSKEPRIVTKKGQDGNLFYDVYDPVDRQSHRFGSEHEVRVWLEERYYQ